MEFVLQAITSANAVWLQAVRQVGWHHAVIACLYMAAACLCYLHPHVLQNELKSANVWRVVTILLFVLATNTVLQGDVWLTHTLRALAKAADWYEGRRHWQYPATVVLVLLAVAATRWLDASLAHPGNPQNQLVLGLMLLLLLVSLRTVSAHGTDALLNLRWLGLSLGRACELIGLGLVLQGCWRSLHCR